MSAIHDEVSIHEIKMIETIMREVNMVAATLATIGQSEAYNKVKMSYLWLTKLKFEIDNTFEYRQFKHSSAVPQVMVKSKFMQEGGMSSANPMKACFDIMESLTMTLEGMIHSSVIRSKTYASCLSGAFYNLSEANLLIFNHFIQ